ncbi:MAG: D-glycero-beta-D-manno-heptose-7-phosphate kinase [Flavobacteriales bacterium]|jgi:rfaE bifunctional protein kinase chain/domain|nr:D-glycero-beta-D-manno-heptose-7-phosphate kinase [Flavobacteriales bacterium]
MNKEEIQQLFQKFNGLTVLIVGDVMIDAYYWGKVERISPEAPVPVVQVNKKENRLGGAANVALNVKSLGAKAIICSVVGDGSKGDIFRTTLKENHFTTEGIIDSPERMTTVKTRVISQGHHLLRVDEEITTPLSATDERHLLDCIKGILNRQKVDVIIFEDYNKGVLTEKVISTVIGFAQEKNIPTTVDPKKDNFFAYKGVTLFKPNLKELREGLKIDFDKNNFDQLKHAISNLKENLQNKITMVTLSELGVMSSDEKGYYHEKAHHREILDVSGAGDTVISVASLALAAGADTHTFTSLANLAGGLVCEKVGVVPVDKEQLLTEACHKISTEQLSL